MQQLSQHAVHGPRAIVLLLELLTVAWTPMHVLQRSVDDNSVMAPSY